MSVRMYQQNNRSYSNDRRSNSRSGYNPVRETPKTPMEKWSRIPVIEAKPIEVVVRGTAPGDVEKAMKVFKRKVMEAGVLDLVRENQAYKKPSEKRRLKKKAAIIRARMERFHPVEDVDNSEF